MARSMAAPPGEASLHTGEMILAQRELNRATLARQLLLDRANMPALDAVEHLVGMQAQVPKTPYVGLWSRLTGFQPEELSELMASRQAVRAPLMRVTIHLASARDSLAWRSVLQAKMERHFLSGTPFGRNLNDFDIDPLLAEARKLIEKTPRSTAELRTLLGERWPERDATSLAYAVSHLLPVVQVTPRGLWHESGQTRWTTMEAWLGQPLNSKASLTDLVLRYLAAFGPASVADMQNWSGLTRLRDHFEKLRPRLVAFRNEQGKELFDLPDAPRPDPDVPAPVRFLPVYDNLLLGHADRSRFFAADTVMPPAAGSGRDVGAILVDGFVRGIWKIDLVKRAAILKIESFPGMPADALPAVREEGERLLAFVAPEAERQEIAFVTF